MNVIKNKIFGYSRFREAGEIPRLSFNTRFSKSAYQDEKLHPALEALLYYIYTDGRIDPMRPLVLNNSDELMAHMLLAKLKAGGWKTLDERIITPIIPMVALQEYLKALPKSLWSNTKPEEWKALSRSIRKRDQSGSIENKGITKMEALKVFMDLKPSIRHFSAKLMISLHEVITRCDEDLQAAAALRMAEFFAGALVRNPEKTIEQTPLTFQLCLAYLIEEAPFIFGSEDAPIYVFPGMSSAIQQESARDYSHHTFRF